MDRTTHNAAAPIEVGVAIVADEAGRVLMVERRPEQLSPGFWELPGGKIEPGETPAAAALRELHEETGLSGQAPVPFAVHLHRFPTRPVRLHLFRMTGWSGTARGREGQRLAWVDPAQPAIGPVLASNLRALALLALPAVVAATDARGCGAAAGADAILLRTSALAPGQRLHRALRLAGGRAGAAARLWLSGSASEAIRAGAQVLHSPAAALRRTAARPPVPLWAAGCEDAEDLGRARQLGADLVLLSPRRGTAPPGWEGFARLARAAGLPVYAEGGLARADLAAARAAGATGIVLDPDCHATAPPRGAGALARGSI
jgi:8-oxo-dGTP diphosphatase